MYWGSTRRRKGDSEKTESEKTTDKLYKALLYRDFDEVRKIMSKGTHIHANYIYKQQTLPEICIECGDVSIASLVLKNTTARYKIAEANKSDGNIYLATAILLNSSGMVDLCLDLDAKPTILEIGKAMDASPKVQRLLLPFADGVFKKTVWDRVSPPSNKLVDYFLSRNLFSQDWLKNPHKYTNETLTHMLSFVPSADSLGSMLDGLLYHLVKQDYVDCLRVNVQKWGVNLLQLAKNPALHATSLPMLSYLKEQGCLDVKFECNRNILHEVINDKSFANEQACIFMVQLGVDPFAQDDQGNTPLHISAADRYMNSNFIDTATNKFTDVRFYTILNSSQQSISEIHKPNSSSVDDFLLLYRFYEQTVNSQQQEPWITRFKENILQFCKKILHHKSNSYTPFGYVGRCTTAVSSFSSMDGLVAYAAVRGLGLMKPILEEKKSLILNQDLGNGYTLLMNYANDGPLDTCKELVQLGADPYATTKEGTTVFKSIRSSEILRYFISLGVEPTLKDIVHLSPKMQAQLFYCPSTHEIVVHTSKIRPSIRKSILEEVVVENTNLEPFIVRKFEEWLEQTPLRQQETLFYAHCAHGNAQFTQSFINIIPSSVLSKFQVGNVTNERTLIILLQEGIPFSTDRLQKQLILPLLRFKPHFILRYGQKLDKNMVALFLSILKRGNHSHLPYHFMEKKILLQADAIIVTHDINIKQPSSDNGNTVNNAKKKEISKKTRKSVFDYVNSDDNENEEEEFENLSFLRQQLLYLRQEKERERFVKDRAPPLANLVVHLQIMVQDMQDQPDVHYYNSDSDVD